MPAWTCPTAAGAERSGCSCGGKGWRKMQADSQRLLERIRLGEDTSVELKELTMTGNRVEGPSRASLADELAAMANAHGCR